MEVAILGNGRLSLLLVGALACEAPTPELHDTAAEDPGELRSGACAAGSPGLAVNLTWDTPREDLDLHLLAPGGELESQLDCFYGNCQSLGNGHLDWGVPGVPEDNPALLVDNVLGVGPEIVRILEPADGTYTVVLHDYPGSMHFGATQATVQVCFDGVEAARLTRMFLLEDDLWHIADIELPERRVHAIESP